MTIIIVKNVNLLRTYSWLLYFIITHRPPRNVYVISVINFIFQ